MSAIPTASERMEAQTIFHSESLRIGRFEARPDDALFDAVAPPGHTLIAFPETEVEVRFERHGPIVVDPTVAALHNHDEEFRRAAISPEGDRCTWISPAPEVLDELLHVRGRDPGSPNRPFVRGALPVPSEVFRSQRLLAARLRTTPRALEALAVEEQVLSWLSHLLSLAEPGDGSAPRPAVVGKAQRLLARRFREDLRLAEIARRVGCSPFHLARVFRRATGRSLHRYRTLLRLRHGFDELQAGRADIATIAVDLGFCHHSHFSARFRAEFGVQPSALLPRAAG